MSSVDCFLFFTGMQCVSGAHAIYWLQFAHAVIRRSPRLPEMASNLKWPRKNTGGAGGAAGGKHASLLLGGFDTDQIGICQLV